MYKKIREMFVKRLPNDFSERSYPNEYWPEKYFLYLNIQLADEVSFEICSDEIYQNILTDQYMIFLWQMVLGM